MTNQDLAFDFMNELMNKYGEDVCISVQDFGSGVFEINCVASAFNAQFDNFDQDEISHLVDNFNYRHEHHNGYCYCESFDYRAITFNISYPKFTDEE